MERVIGGLGIFDGSKESLKGTGTGASREEAKFDGKEVAGTEEVTGERLLTILVITLREDSRREIGRELERDCGPGLGMWTRRASRNWGGGRSSGGRHCRARSRQ